MIRPFVIHIRLKAVLVLYKKPPYNINVNILYHNYKTTPP